MIILCFLCVCMSYDDMIYFCQDLPMNVSINSLKKKHNISGEVCGLFLIAIPLAWSQPSGRDKPSPADRATWAGSGATTQTEMEGNMKWQGLIVH